MSIDLIAAEAELGEAARRFLESDMGRLIAGRAGAEADEAFIKLKDIDPEDSETIRKLQNDIWRAESVITWIAETIERGNSAIDEFEELNSE